ncbi:KGGVGR-motif variant AAA ATPase [Legionella sp. CNM-1927-20]|uniref:KGGVGR-motif variant AAA ATPase n=1 Tax=Legionella sp. CNM-1927-20 TaxID=3422221 RepID=UPI00403AA6F4
MIPFKTFFTTFYSYKGGVGRTSALVNSALLRAFSGDRVVVLDFDLEAPGVTSYLNEIAQKNNKNVDLDTRRGILDYLYDAIENNHVTDLKVNSITGENLGLEMEGNIWFVGAGNTSDPEYSKKLCSINWAEIFEKKNGAILLENMKRQIESEFGNPDYVFIDSRTGITETGGVCTKYLADLVVMLTSLNEQNIIGTSRVFEAFKKSNISTILVASNVPVGLPWGDNQLFTTRIENFKNTFHSLPDLLIYHYPSLSLVEYLPSWFKYEKKSSILKEDPLLKSYETLSNEIESKNNNSFDKFLNEMLFSSGMIFDNKEKNFEEWLSSMRRHYSNRIGLYELIENLNLLKRSIKNLKDELDNNFMELFKKVKKSTYSRQNSNLFFLRSILLDQSSMRLVSYYKKHKDKLAPPFDWYNLIEQSSKLDALELLIDADKFDFVYEAITDKNIGGYFTLAKAYVADKLNKSDAKKYFNIFLTDTYNERIESSSASFACAFAAFKLHKIDMYKSCLINAKELIKKDNGPYYFIPTKFKKLKSKGEYKKELLSFEKNCSKKL